MTDEQWRLIEPLIPPARPGGRPRSANIREVINAIFYLLRTGCSWRMLPHDLPPWGTVHYYFWLWRRSGFWEELHTGLRQQVREQAGRDKEPSAAILDSQSLKTGDKGGAEIGYDAGKQIKGRKRHLLVDTLGLILMVVVHSAGQQDRDGAKYVLWRSRGRFARLRLIWADAGYGGALVEWVATFCTFVLQIVHRPEEAQGFVLVKKRWIVERTLDWLVRWRRLVRDYECLPESSETMVYLAMVGLMLNRLKPRPKKMGAR